jgi:hypothetical protein
MHATFRLMLTLGTFCDENPQLAGWILDHTTHTYAFLNGNFIHPQGASVLFGQQFGHYFVDCNLPLLPQSDTIEG